MRGSLGTLCCAESWQETFGITSAVAVWESMAGRLLSDRGMLHFFSGSNYTGGIVQFIDQSQRSRCMPVPHGNGAMEDSDGSWYKGEWKYGSRCGFGIWVQGSSGMKYEGEWKGDCFSGRGTFTIMGHAVIDGTFAKGKLSGHAVCRWEDGSWYEGGYTAGEKSGKGEGHLRLQVSHY